MGQGIDMTVNRLPARTWNWLHMNESSLSCIGADQLCTADANVSGSGVRFTPTDKHAAAFAETPDWDEMETALGPDMDRLLEKRDERAAGAGQRTAADSLTAAEGKGSKKDTPSVLTYTYMAGARSMSRLYLHAEKDSELNVAILCRTAEAGAQLAEAGKDGAAPAAGQDIQADSLAALQIKVRAEDGAKVRIYLVQMLDAAFTALADIGGTAGADAEIELVRLELGAGQLYAGAAVELAGKRSRFEAHIGYAAKSGQHLDMNYTARHKGKKTESLMTASGVLAADSFKIFRGTIDFPNGCAGAKGTESEEVLLLGDSVVNQTIPLILCSEEDVEGNHGASIGRLDESMLFYLNARGIPTDEAERLMARAKLDAVCNMIPSKEVRNEVQRFMGGDEEEDA